MRFSDILASIIHDMKDSLGMVINTLEEVSSESSETTTDPRKLTLLQHETKRINNNLIQLLTLYKYENERLAPNITDQSVDEFLDEVIAENRQGLEARGITIDSCCEPDLVGYFDEDLIRGVVNNAIGNASRYTCDKILLTAESDGDYVAIRIEDNGPGFPPPVLAMQQGADKGDGFIAGHTQLGLYFSDMVARLHVAADRTGVIRLENNHTLHGGCFSILLP